MPGVDVERPDSLLPLGLRLGATAQGGLQVIARVGGGALSSPELEQLLDADPVLQVDRQNDWLRATHVEDHPIVVLLVR